MVKVKSFASLFVSPKAQFITVKFADNTLKTVVNIKYFINFHIRCDDPILSKSGCVIFAISS